MSLTEEQERYLAEFADKGLAEEAETAERNKQVLVDMEVSKAREQKKNELEEAAQDFINKGMQEFETIVAPTIDVEK